MKGESNAVNVLIGLLKVFCRTASLPGCFRVLGASAGRKSLGGGKQPFNKTVQVYHLAVAQARTSTLNKAGKPGMAIVLGGVADGPVNRG
jgi:hypothetical protein